MTSHKLSIKANILAEEFKPKDDKHPILQESPKELFEIFSSVSEFSGTTEKINDEVDSLSQAMGSCATQGFKEHDLGSLESAELYFFAKDVNFFYDLVKNSRTGRNQNRVNEEDILDASVAYVKALDAKDCHEYANLSKEAKSQISESGVNSKYFNLGTEELRNLTNEEKQMLNLRNVSSEDFLIGNENKTDPWEEILEDEEGVEVVRSLFRERGKALGIPDRLYSEHEIWWIPHKAVESYEIDCAIARYAELGAATQLDEFYDQAKSLKAVKNGNKRKANELSLKPSDGKAGIGPLASYYLSPVENHDNHSLGSALRMQQDVAIYYKATQLPRLANNYNASDIVEYGLSFDQGLDTFNKYMEQSVEQSTEVLKRLESKKGFE